MPLPAVAHSGLRSTALCPRSPRPEGQADGTARGLRTPGEGSPPSEGGTSLGARPAHTVTALGSRHLP